MFNILFLLILNTSSLSNGIENSSWYRDINGINEVRIYSDKFFVVSKYDTKNKTFISTKGGIYSDPNTYTQGLLLDQNDFLESSGQYGKSFIRRINSKNGKIINEIKIDKNLFAEGITTYENKLYMLSWKSNKGLIFNKNNFKIIDEIEYNTEGWGLSTYKDNLVMSDGSEKLYFRDPITFNSKSYNYCNRI